MTNSFSRRRRSHTNEYTAKSYR